MPDVITKIASYIPSVKESVQKLTFREKAKWTLIILVLFFVLGSITVYGINSDAVAQFEFLEIVFGSKFGSIITLGIGPIVTSSIILQLLIGSKIINWDLSDEEDKKKFSGMQKIMTIAFCFIEGAAYVIANAVPPATPGLGMTLVVILQLTMGGIIIMYMDEVVSKWGFGSGVSIFIVAGVAKTIMVRSLNPLTQACGQGGTLSSCLPINGASPSGIIPSFIATLMQGTLNMSSLLGLIPLVGTILVFIIVVFVQNIQVEIPMAFSMPYGKFASRRWPLKFLYTSNIPVILVAAVLANIQVLGKVLYEKGINILGTFSDRGAPNPGGLMYYLSAPSNEIGIMIVTITGSLIALLFVILAIRILKKNALKMCILGAVIGMALGYFFIFNFNLPGITLDSVMHALIYMSVYIIGSVVFSIFWTATSGMDAKSVADQFKTYSIMIPGFRHDPRIVENVLNRYIPALTIIGGAFIGFLASYADLTSAIGTGTGLLLGVMIVYQLYEQITAQHSEDMPPVLRKFLGD